MTTDNKAPRDIIWVPEDFVFNSAEECLGVFSDNGPACRFPTQSAYDKLQSRLEKCEALLAESGKSWCQSDEQLDAIVKYFAEVEK